MTPEEQDRIVKAGLAKMRVAQPDLRVKDELDQMGDRLVETNRKILSILGALFQTERETGHVNAKGLSQTCSKLYLGEFHSWSKDDLVIAMCVVHTCSLMHHLLNE